VGPAARGFFTNGVAARHASAGDRRHQLDKVGAIGPGCILRAAIAPPAALSHVALRPQTTETAMLLEILAMTMLLALTARLKDRD
jgi:hypothetical protein